MGKPRHAPPQEPLFCPSSSPVVGGAEGIWGEGERLANEIASLMDHIDATTHRLSECLAGCELKLGKNWRGLIT